MAFKRKEERERKKGTKEISGSNLDPEIDSPD
jgi:hypothetical protein